MELQIWKGDWGLPTVDPKSLTIIAYCALAGQEIPMVECKGRWSGRELPVLTLPQTEEYVETTQNIINFLSSHEVTLDEHLEPSQTSEMLAYIVLITETLYTAMMCSWWLNEQHYNNVTKPWFSDVGPFPFSYIVPMQMRRKVECMISSRYSIDGSVNTEEMCNKVYQSGKRCLAVLSTKLDNKPYIFGNVPCQLDALMFAHLAIIRSAPMPSCPLKECLSSLPNLSDYTLKLHKKLFPKRLRLYVPPTYDHTLRTTIHKAASVGFVVVLAAIYMVYMRDGVRLKVNQKELTHVEELDEY